MTFGPKFEFGSKAETLERLAPHLGLSSVPEFIYFTVGEWTDPAGQRRRLAGIRERFGDDPVIIRSSTRAEDSGATTMAGAYASIGPVPASSADKMSEAIDEVIASYDTGRADDHILVQRMIEVVSLSGVAFTQDMNTGAPYYVINYDDETGLTDTVTAGVGYSNRTLYVFRDAWTRLQSVRFRTIIESIREIESIVGDTNLDIEFALDREHNVHLFQVRRITTQPNWNRGQALRVGDALTRIEESLGSAKHDVLLGNMPDWNPAEMIGTTPRPLALSLYRTLITDSVWRRARRDMGYSHTPGARLMVSLAGQPYIDVRHSFRSFLPASLPAPIADKLVDAWARRLRENPHLHDKVEFEVAITAYAPDFDQRVATLIPSELSPDDLSRFGADLRSLTNELICGRRAPIVEQLETIERLAAGRGEGTDDYDDPSVQTVCRLLEDTAALGTRPFAVLARHAFVATAMLDGLVGRGVLTVDDAEAFRRSVPTVATEFIRTVHDLADGRIGHGEVLNRFGHLRPGTYDILSPRYDHQGATGLSLGTTNPLEPGAKFVLSPEQRAQLEVLLGGHGYDFDVDTLMVYLSAAIQGREYAKFVFTHNVSDLLEVVAAIGRRHGISRDELSFIDIRQFIDAFVEPSGRSIEGQLRDLSQAGRERHQATLAVRLPSLISRPSDVWIVPLTVEQPNYVTRKNITADVVEVSGSMADPGALDDKIVAITSADPGFDWIFTRPIAGLVTRFGGANSHMAIRCAEFGIPAAIGCGEQIYERVVSRGRVSLDCADGRIVAL